MFRLGQLGSVDRNDHRYFGHPITPLDSPWVKNLHGFQTVSEWPCSSSSASSGFTVCWPADHSPGSPCRTSAASLQARLGRQNEATSASSECHFALQVATGTVVNGKIVLEGVPLAEGAKVTVVTRGAAESFSLSEAQENALPASIAEMERGEYVTLEKLLASLPKHG